MRFGRKPQAAAPAAPEVVERNIRALVELRKQEEARIRRPERVARAITQFVGSMGFVYVHAVGFGGWILLNLLSPGARHIDPPPFSLLGTVAGLEAIFLSTFVLITQNRMSTQADRRADLDLQVNLLAEHEITRILSMLEEIHQQLGMVPGGAQDLHELKQEVQPEVVLDKIQEVEQDVKQLQQEVQGTP